MLGQLQGCAMRQPACAMPPLAAGVALRLLPAPCTSRRSHTTPHPCSSPRHAGVKRLSGNGTVPWPQRAVAPGVCGDPSTASPDNVDSSAVPNAHMLGVEPTYTTYFTAVPPPTYAPGSALPATFAIQAYHKGRISFQLCRFAAGGDATEACLAAGQLSPVAGQPGVLGAFFYPPAVGTYTVDLQLPAARAQLQS